MNNNNATATHCNPLVSIVVPVYKTQAYLKQCIQSLLAQSYPFMEIILVDDGSPDECPALCDMYAENHSNIRVIHKQNEGASFARKTGLEAATGQYVLFCDGDDWLDTDTVAACISVALRDQADCVMFGYIREYHDKSIKNPLFANDFTYGRAESEQKIHRRLIGPTIEELREPHKIDNVSSFCMKLYRTEIARRGLFVSERDIGTSEDTVFNLYALDKCTVSYINNCFYHYRKTNALSITTRYKADLSDKWDTLYRIFQEYIATAETGNNYHEFFLNRVACGMIGLGLNEVSGPDNLFKKAKRVRSILNKPLYREAFSNLNISHCGIQWKLFFILCKKNAAFPLVLLLIIINYLRSRVSA